MAVLLRVEIRNQLHQVLREFTEPPGEPFLRFCRRAAARGVRYVDFIWPYQDAMLNPFQMLAWFEDFPRVLDDPDFDAEEVESARRFLSAAREAEAVDGYLFVEG